jgi:regulator of replication initiation timing
MKRLTQITEQLQSQFAALRKETDDKDTQVRTLQTAMGSMSAENASLREENEKLKQDLSKNGEGVRTRNTKLKSSSDQTEN